MNIASGEVARRNGMRLVDAMVKHYRGVDMSHLVYKVEKRLLEIELPKRLKKISYICGRTHRRKSG